MSATTIAKNAVVGVGDLAQWKSACLVSARPWVWSPAPKRKKKKEMLRMQLLKEL
ncbi:rCG30389 [Rattus norvegicus]|uniref:RCG30389 n=1 Tax=Rattus norvegicus TaxID=10116 RepID=A6JFI8_RAT|nr:rCG30389 [Rattus norvegicus]